MYNFEKDVINWNRKRGFLDKGFNPVLEISFILSEIFEVLDYEKIKKLILNSLIKNNELYKELEKTSNHDEFALFLSKHFLRKDKNEIDYIDMFTDIDIFSVGARAKLGLNDKDIQNIRKVVMDINHQKPIGKVNKFGKQTKPKNLLKAEDEIKNYLEPLIHL